MTVGKAGHSPAKSSTGVGIGALKAIVAVVEAVDVAAVGAPRAHVTAGAKEVTAVPSLSSRSIISVQLPVRGQRSSSASAKASGVSGKRLTGSGV